MKGRYKGNEIKGEKGKGKRERGKRKREKKFLSYCCNLFIIFFQRFLLVVIHYSLTDNKDDK